MKCEEVLQKIDAYIHHDLSNRELEEFLDHIKDCPDCYDELEIYYTISQGMKYLEEEKPGSYDIPRMLKADLRKMEELVRRRRRRTRIVCTLGFLLCVGAMLFMLLYFEYIELPNLL